MRLVLNIFFICLAFTLILHGNLHSQEVVPEKYTYPGKTYLKSYLYDGINTVKSPFYFGQKEWLITGSIAGAGLLAWHYDEEIQSYIRKIYNKDISNVGEYFLEPVTGGYAAVPILATLWLYSYSRGNTKHTHAALQGTKAFIIARAISYVPKFLAHRERPHDQDSYDKNIWYGPSFKTEHTSFPSGHAASAFALAGVIAYEYKEYNWVAPVSYSVATIASFSRVYRDKHWATDMIAGCAIGLITAYAINKMPEKITLGPATSQLYQGIGVFYKLP